MDDTMQNILMLKTKKIISSMFPSSAVTDEKQKEIEIASEKR